MRSLGPTRTKYQLNKQIKTQFVFTFAERISFTVTEHGKLVAESSESYLALNRAHRAHLFLPEVRQKKAGRFKSKAGKWDCAKKRELTPESSNVDTYAVGSM